MDGELGLLEFVKQLETAAKYRQDRDTGALAQQGEIPV
jgi:hypothetical protein